MLRLVLIFIITFLMVMDAGADPRDRDRGARGGWHGGDRGHSWSRPWQGPVWRPQHDNAAGGILGGIIGGYLWRQFNDPAPVVVEGPPRDLEWCYQRYKSFDGYTYLGFDGLRHRCP